jgi:hypothetical protein
LVKTQAIAAYINEGVINELTSMPLSLGLQTVPGEIASVIRELCGHLFIFFLLLFHRDVTCLKSEFSKINLSMCVCLCVCV